MASASVRDQLGEMDQVAERWRPCRSLVVGYLFASEFEKGT